MAPTFTRPTSPEGFAIRKLLWVGHLGPGSYLMITPLVSWSWGIEEPGSEPGKVGRKKIMWK